MKLYDVPQRKNLRIRITLHQEVSVPPAHPREIPNELNFSHIDGQYSYCTDEDR